MSKWKYRKEGKHLSETQLSRKSTIELIQARDYIKDLLWFKAADKQYKTYILGTEQAIENNGEPKIYYRFNFDGTVTGRLSCTMYKAKKKKMGVSFHTLTGDNDVANIRSLYIPPKGYRFGIADYSTAELRVLSKVAKVKTMQEAFKTDLDFHKFTASLMFDKHIDEVTKRERSIAKSCSFLIVYGGGAFNLAETFGLSIKQAAQILERYQALYPEIFHYMDYIGGFIEENEYAYTIFGRRRHLPDIRSRNTVVRAKALRQGLNFSIQSPASDLLLCALIDIGQEFKNRRLQSKIAATVHDSIEFLIKIEDQSEVLPIIKDKMVGCQYAYDKFDVDFRNYMKIDMEIGDSFGTGEPVEI